MKRLKSSINAVIAKLDATRPIIAPFRFFLYLYMSAQVVEKMAVERKSIRNPQGPASPMELNSISVVTKEMAIE